jgi:hypothetical protein
MTWWERNEMSAAVIPGQLTGPNPESRDSGSPLRAVRNDGGTKRRPAGAGLETIDKMKIDQAVLL